MDTPQEPAHQPDLAEIVAGLEALIGQEHVSEDYVRFRVDLLQAQWQTRSALQDRAEVGPAESAGSVPHPAEHGGRLQVNDVSFDRHLLETLLSGLCDSLARRGGESADAARLVTEARKEAGLLEELTRRSAFGPDLDAVAALSKRTGIGSDALLFFGRALAAPFVAAAAQRTPLTTARAGNGRGTSGSCPACGSPPGLAKLVDEQGRRILCCSLCGLEWRFVRLECPFCGNRSSAGLHFLRVGEDEPRWVETCDKCNKYVKTTDTRKLSSGVGLIPLVEDTATLHLDLLAEREGCARKLPYAALR